MRVNRRVLGWMTCGIAVAVVTVARGQHSERLTTFQQYWGMAKNAHAAGNYEEAAEYYERGTELLSNEPSGRFNLGCCLAMTGAIDEALASLTEAVRYGWDDSDRLRDEPELEALQGVPGFEEIIAQAEANFAEPVALYAGDPVSSAAAAPLLVVLHGTTGNPRMHLWHWTEVADRLGMIVAAPRGIEPWGERLTYAWSKPGTKAADNIKKCAQRIDQAIQLAAKRYRVDGERIYLGGFSQGGMEALRLLGNNPKKFAGALVFGTVYEQQKRNYWKRANAQRAIGVYLVVGARDPMKPHTDMALQHLRRGGVAAEKVVVPDIGHEIPEDCLEYQTIGLKFLMER